jgi:riboflavin synthase
MFTGIIESLGTIKETRQTGHSLRLIFDAGFDLAGSKVGDSICVNGACLTAVEISGSSFQADVSPETLARTTFGKARVKERVNLERALRLSDRLDGHLVTGHIDGAGVIRQRKTVGNAVIITIAVPGELARYMIEKGSVAVDGISLTINRCDREDFEVSIIPHTAALTTIGFKNVGAAVNIETDLIGKYVERFVNKRSGGDQKDATGKIDMSLLARSGFL